MYEEQKYLRSANLIVHQGVANILHQTIELPCVLWLVEETHKVFFGRD